MAIGNSLRIIVAGALVAAIAAGVRANAQEAPQAIASPSGPHLDFPAGLDTDGSAVYVASSRNNTITRIDLSGAISIVAGTMSKEGSNDGIGPAALFKSPDGLTVMGGALYVVDTDNSDIRKIDLASKRVTTIAGAANIAGSENGKGPDAHFNLPTQICGDGKGVLYVADTNNSEIRKIVLAEMVVSTIGGQAPDGEGNVDGPPSKSKFNRPRGVATDGKSLYVADTANQVIRKIDLSTNTTTTVAGSGQPGDANGKGAEASFNNPEALATDGATLYIADADNHAIRKMNLADGTVSTLTQVNGHIGSGMAISKDGKTLYFSDTTENSIQQVEISSGNFVTLYPK